MRVKLFLIILVACSLNAVASHIDTLYVESDAMKKLIPNLVILPDSYGTQNKQCDFIFNC